MGAIAAPPSHMVRQGLLHPYESPWQQVPSTDFLRQRCQLRLHGGSDFSAHRVDCLGCCLPQPAISAAHPVAVPNPRQYQLVVHLQPSEQ